MPRIVTVETVIRTRIEVEDHHTIEALRKTALPGLDDIFSEDLIDEDTHSAHADALAASSSDIVSQSVEHKILEGSV
jgi:hypothetical protein